MTTAGSTPRDALAEQRLTAWAECVQRLIAVAPIANVMDETGMYPIGHSTPPERKAIREKARSVVAAWLARDLAILALAAHADSEREGTR